MSIEPTMLTGATAVAGETTPPPLAPNVSDAVITPVDTDERLHSLDILRGLALCFMVLVHFHQRVHAEGSTGIQGLIAWGVWIFVEQKAWGVFAFLFGAGFALFLRRLDARGARTTPIYLRRLATLAVIGLVVLRVLEFDILLTYAAWGLVLLLVRRLPTKVLLGVAVLSLMARPCTAAAQALYWHLAGLPPSPRAFWWVAMPDANLALFILGLLAIRYRVLDEPLRHTRLIRGWMIGGAIVWAVHWLVMFRLPDVPIEGLSWPLRAGFGLLDEQLLCLTYAGAVVLLLAHRPRLVERLALVGAAGRMALTNYVAQATLVHVLSKPLGIRLHEYAYVAATIGVCAALVGFSRLWLSRYRFGPLEWIWRMASYARWSPLRREGRHSERSWRRAPA